MLFFLQSSDETGIGSEFLLSEIRPASSDRAPPQYLVDNQSLRQTTRTTPRRLDYGDREDKLRARAEADLKRSVAASTVSALATKN